MIQEANKKIKELHLEMVSLCFELTAKGCDSFYGYNGHVDWAEIRVCDGKWEIDKEYKYQKIMLFTKCDDDYDEDSIQIILDNLNKVISTLKAFLNGE